MMDDPSYQKALGQLRELLARTTVEDPVFASIANARDRVHARYGPVFSQDHADSLTEEEFKSFLHFENNQHWSGLNRCGYRAATDMRKLRSAIKDLLDESKPIAGRFSQIVATVSGLGRALASAILLVAFPAKYGVWNSTSEGAMKVLGMWPKFERGDSVGRKYDRINSVLNAAAGDLGVDLWTLDALWWRVASPSEESTPVEALPSPSAGEYLSPSDAQRFGLEKHLQEFLFANWDRTELGADWVLYAEDNDEEAGFEFPTEIGRIDLLAKHRKKPRWLVVELKRDQSSDQTVGQVLRYMGWVRKNLARPGDTVEGLVISRETDKGLAYALSGVENVSVRLYEVEFRLRTPPEE